MRAVIVSLFILFACCKPIMACFWEWSGGSQMISDLWRSPESVAYVTDSLVYVANEYLYKSTDGGRNWSFVTTEPLLSAGYNWITFADSNVGFLGPLTYTSFLKTTDGGASWVEGTMDFTQRSSVHAPDALHLYCLGDDSRIHSSSDGGLNWSQSVSSFANYTVKSMFFLDPYNGWLIADVGNEESRVFRSLDGGINWNYMYTFPNVYYDRPIVFRNASIGYIGGPYELFRTADSGHTWQSVFTGAAHDINIVSDIDIYALTNNFTMIRSHDQGTTWSTDYIQEIADLQPSVGMGAMVFNGPNAGMITAGLGSLILTDDGGQTWDTYRGRKFPNIVRASKYASTTWLIDDSRRVWRSRTEYSPYNIYTFQSSYQPHDICAINDSTAFVVADSGVIFKTEDEGYTWTAVPTPTASRLNDLAFYSSGNLGFACGDSGTILRSTNRGDTWEVVSEGLTVSLNSIGEDEVFAAACVGENGTVLLSVDNGLTWYPTDFPTNDNLLGLHLYDEKLAVYGTNGAFFVSTDGGDTWTDSTFTDFDIIDFKTSQTPGRHNLFLFSNEYFGCGQHVMEQVSHGFTDLLALNDRFVAFGDSATFMTMWYSSFLPTEQQRELPSSISLSAYPNPFNSTATLQFELPRETRVEIILYDVLGRVALNLADEIYTSGAHTLRIDAASLTSGVYFANLRTPEFSTTQKLLLLR